MNPIRQIAFTNELRFARKRHEVFEAFLETEKWFQISYGGERLKRIINHVYEFIEGESTVLRQRFSAFGPISDEMAEGINAHGSLATFEPQLRAWIERGEVIPPPDLG